MGIKKRKFYADFESVEKVAKKFTRRKIEGWIFFSIVNQKKL